MNEAYKAIPETRYICIPLYKQVQTEVNPTNVDVVTMPQFNSLLQDGWQSKDCWKEKGAIFYALERANKILLS